MVFLLSQELCLPGREARWKKEPLRSNPLADQTFPTLVLSYSTVGSQQVARRGVRGALCIIFSPDENMSEGLAFELVSFLWSWTTNLFEPQQRPVPLAYKIHIPIWMRVICRTNYSNKNIIRISLLHSKLVGIHKWCIAQPSCGKGQEHPSGERSQFQLYFAHPWLSEMFLFYKVPIVL